MKFRNKKTWEIKEFSCIEINSSKLSAQNRKRLYRTNIPWVEQPQDKWILLKDILEKNVDEKYNISEKQWEKLRNYESNSRLSQLNWKSYCLNTMQWWHRQPKIVDMQVWNSNNFWNARWNEKWYTLKSNTWHWLIEFTETPRIRKLTPIECERLQTVSDNYTAKWIKDWKEVDISNTQRYKMLGNWWTVDVIAHIFIYINKVDDK